MLAHSSACNSKSSHPEACWRAAAATARALRRAVTLWARMRAQRLDERLAAGADPLTSPTSGGAGGPAGHAQVPSAHRGGAGAAWRWAPTRPSQTVRHPARARGDRAQPRRLLALAMALRSGEPAYAGGIAEARLIVTDGTGPAFTDRRGEGLTRQLDLAQARLCR